MKALAWRPAGLRNPIAVGVHAPIGADGPAAVRAAGISLPVSCDTVEHSTNHIPFAPGLRPVRGHPQP